MALKGLDPVTLALAVAAYVSHLEFLIPSVFGIVLLLTTIQSVILIIIGKSSSHSAPGTWLA